MGKAQPYPWRPPQPSGSNRPPPRVKLRFTHATRIRPYRHRAVSEETPMKRPLLWLTRAAILFPLIAVAGLALVPAAESPPAWRTDLAAATREAKAAGK